ncbi:tRNA dihydrouridine synthase [Candidatus Laterigemmans baculatus]|uniref:tRNA dihydrouridine synthase n=1 Tax=Candidatus Laterigemmans baculatus TaxID=2770505 RepID=UPI0013DC69EB|nr:tRNA-dihydrouridine synthase [Candidatus Laterigemmans baculatus]
MPVFPATSPASSNLLPLSIGPLRIGFPVVQAALSGYSDLPMRVLARRHGASYSVCEVMLDQFLLAIGERRKTQHFLAIADEEHPVGGQLMGAEPEQFAAGAERLAAAGFDVIDINFGCPVKKVLGRCRGGFHLSQPDVALDIIRRTRDIVPAHLPVTVKMRRGIDDTDEARENFFRILDGAIEAGVAGVTVHGRTVAQRYIGPSRWSFLAEVTRHVAGRISVLGSGDLFSAADCLRMIAETGVDGVTVARGAIGNPWIFAQAQALAAGEPLPPPPSLPEQAAVIREHFRLIEQIYGPERAPLLMRKFAIKYSASHPQHETVRLRVVRLRSAEELWQVLEEFYATGEGQYPPEGIHRSQEE